MKRTALLLILLAIPFAAHAQSITLGPIAKTAYCVGDTMLVPYTATGTFNPGNYFFAQLSDTNGSFMDAPPIGHASSSNGSIPVRMGNLGSGFRVRIASSYPFDTSQDNGGDLQVSRFAVLYPWSRTSGHPLLGPDTTSGYFAVGLVGDTISFLDTCPFNPAFVPSGSTLEWNFADDANISVSSELSPRVVYPTEGIKTAVMHVTTPGGCTASTLFHFLILSCYPRIPSDAHIVTGVEEGSHTYTWVKAGGQYTNRMYDGYMEIVYVDSGGEITLNGGIWSQAVYYLRQGAIVTPGRWDVAVVLNRGQYLFLGNSGVDSFQCPDLTFDYSQVSGGVAEEARPAAPRISQSGERLFVSAEDAALSVRVVNVLGNDIASADGRGMVDIDLTPLTGGIYFAIAQSGHERTIKRIVAAH